jgi:hypothetical protein
MGPRNAYKDMLDNEVSLITCVSMNHQNQLEQMANGAMFATQVDLSNYWSCSLQMVVETGEWRRVMAGLNQSKVFAECWGRKCVSQNAGVGRSL